MSRVTTACMQGRTSVVAADPGGVQTRDAFGTGLRESGDTDLGI